MDATQCIERHFTVKNKPHGSSWWRDAFYKPGVTLPSGCENFSPAAFPQGHMVHFTYSTSSSETDYGTLSECGKTHHFKIIAH